MSGWQKTRSEFGSFELYFAAASHFVTNITWTSLEREKRNAQVESDVIFLIECKLILLLNCIKVEKKGKKELYNGIAYGS